MDYITVHRGESFGAKTSFGIHIEVAASPKLPNLKDDKIRSAINRATENIAREIQAVMIREDLNSVKETKNNRELVELFPQPIYVEEIPNQYCNDYCCRHIPWFVVTTVIGRFKIGWRKRVISIDWSETDCKIDGHTLFMGEETTKGVDYIHAWSLEEAKHYIKTILTGA